MVEVKTVRTTAFEMDYISFGTGTRTMVMIPGLSLHSVMLQSDAVAGAYRIFHDRYTVFLFDRKHDIKAGYSLAGMAADTAEAMRALGLKDVDMIGFSQGGMIAMLIAAGFPELVHKLVLGSTSAYPGESSRRIVERWAAMASGDDVVKLNHEMFRQIYSPGYLEKYRNAFARLENMGTRKEMDRLAVLAEACLYHDARGCLDHIECPVFVLCSDSDELFPVSDSQYLASATGGELFVYEGFSHAVYDEAPDFKQRILDFLTE